MRILLSVYVNYISPYCPNRLLHGPLRIFKVMVLQGSKVVLDAEEGGDKLSITSLDSATSITTDMLCFMSSDGLKKAVILMLFLASGMFL